MDTHENGSTPVHPSLSDVLDAAVLNISRPLAAALTVFYVVVGLGHLAMLAPPARDVMTTVAAATVVAFVVLRVVITRRWFRSTWANAAAGLITALAGVNSWLHIYLTGDAQSTTNFALLTIGIGCVFLSVRWLVGCLLLLFASWVYVAAFVHPSGDWAHYAFLLFGSVILCLVVFVARRRALVRTWEAERRYQALVEQLPVITYILQLDEGARPIFVSPQVESLLGISARRWVADPAIRSATIYPDDRAGVLAELHRLWSAGKSYDLEYRVVTSGGEVRWFRDKATVLASDQSKKRRAYGVKIDVTDAKNSERELVAKQSMLEHLLATHECNRQLTAYELHDSVAQQIAAALMHLDGFPAEAIALANARADGHRQVRRLLHSAMIEVRRLISGLRPPIIDDHGVIAAIDYLVAEQSSDGQLQVEFTHDVHFDRLAPLLEVNIYRIVQEALNNVRNHGHSRSAKVVLREHDDHVRLEITDQGSGFDPEQVAPHRFGLRGIRERARMLHGTAEIVSTPGAGTTVVVELPLELVAT